MRAIHETRQFRRDIKKLKKQGRNLEKLKQVVLILVSGDALEARCSDHALIGSWQGSRDCHIEPDWLLIYRNETDQLFLERTRTKASFSINNLPPRSAIRPRRCAPGIRHSVQPIYSRAVSERRGPPLQVLLNDANGGVGDRESLLEFVTPTAKCAQTSRFRAEDSSRYVVMWD